MALLYLNIFRMIVVVSDLYTLCIFSVSVTLSCLRLFSCAQRQFIFWYILHIFLVYDSAPVSAGFILSN